jgi:cyclophilin family peptidyl-prolyl cis-trans isomerase
MAQATFKTSMGDIGIELDTNNTPSTVENFTKLATSDFYNGTKFHRVIEDFMIQGGDPLTKDDAMQGMWGTGGPGYKFADEIKPTNKNLKGTISMANSGPNTNGSQFFINVADNVFLDSKHTVFGHVVSGYELVEEISRVKTGQSDRPAEAIVINSIEISS